MPGAKEISTSGKAFFSDVRRLSLSVSDPIITFSAILPPHTMAFTPEDVQRLAKLARIELDPTQVTATLGHLDNIFGMIAELRQVKTDGIAPMAHACDVGQRLRVDQVTDGSIEQRDRCLALAPESEAGLYLVPKVIE